ncbi:MAG TPA: hypothetical protein VE987_14675 [Polyangiaceae bacterium]|nr:hypothetical protein [Polyangiaceae bacterium]
MAGPKRFRKVQLTDRGAQLLQESVKASLDSVTGHPLLNSKIIAQVPLAIGSNLVSHGLGRAYLSWFAGNLSGPARLSYGVSPDKTTIVNVVSDANVSADLLVL